MILDFCDLRGPLEPSLVVHGSTVKNLCSEVLLSKPGMDNIRPVEVFNLVQKDQDFVHSPCLFDRNSLRLRKKISILAHNEI